MKTVTKDKVAILVHGYNVVNPEKTVGKLRPYFEKEGFIVEMFTYGYVPFTWQITKRNPALANKLYWRIAYWKCVKKADICLVGHSNGCAIINLLGDMLKITYKRRLDNGESIINVAMAINPALKTTKHPCSVSNCTYVYYNAEDKAVVMSKYLRWLTPWAKKARPWGEMGAVGYKGNDTNIHNIDCMNDFGPLKAKGHSAVFKKPQSQFFLQHIAYSALIEISNQNLIKNMDISVELKKDGSVTIDVESKL